jgi:bifunctional non-homologous end joining protein LigD
MKSISLYYKDGSSNKEYHTQMVKSDKGVVVNFQYGRVGNALQTGTKTPTPVSEVEAEKIYDKLVKEKIGKGYKEREDSEKKNDFSGPATTEKKTHGIFPQLLNAIDNVQDFINDDKYLAQQKLDGMRRMVVAENRVVIGLNKKGQTVQLTDSIMDAVTYFDCILDAEIISDKLYVFDILSFEGKDFKEKSCHERIVALNYLHFGKAIEVVQTAFTREEKQKMYDDLREHNAEGIVFKLKSSKYVAGRPNSGGSQVKFKFQNTGTFIVADITKDKRSVGLEMINNIGERVFMGKCTISPNFDVPKVGTFVEIQYLYCYPNGGKIFQPVFLTEREDCDMTDINMSQLVYKAD